MKFDERFGDFSYGKFLLFFQVTAFLVVNSKFCNCRWKPKFGLAPLRAARTAFSESYQGISVTVIIYDVANVVLRDIPAKLEKIFTLFN